MFTVSYERFTIRLQVDSELLGESFEKILKKSGYPTEFFAKRSFLEPSEIALLQGMIIAVQKKLGAAHVPQFTWINLKPLQEIENSLADYWLAQANTPTPKVSTPHPDLFMENSGYTDTDEKIGAVSNPDYWDELNPRRLTQPQDFLIETSEKEMEQRKRDMGLGLKEHSYRFPRVQAYGIWYKRTSYYLLAWDTQRHLKLFFDKDFSPYYEIWESGEKKIGFDIQAKTLASAKVEAATALRKKYSAEPRKYPGRLK